MENLNTFAETYDQSTSAFRSALPLVHKCPKADRCLNDVDEIQGNCAEGYSGWMCTICEDNYFPILGYCRKCPSVLVFVFESSLVLVFVLLLVLLLVKTSSPNQGTRGRSVMDIALARGKIMLGFYQIIGEFWESIDIIFWPDLLKSITSWLDLLQFNISSILIKPSCFIPRLTLTPYTEFLIGNVIPYLVILVFVCIMGIAKVKTNYLLGKESYRSIEITANLHSFRNTMLTIVTLILFVTYTSTCNVTFALYGPTCEQFYLDEFADFNISLLRSDYSISCSTSMHRNFQVAAYVASLYVIAFPATMFILLLKYAKRGHHHDISNEEHNQTYPTWLRFLNENYNENFWFWEIVELVRKVSQTFVVILFGWNSYLSITITLTLAVVFITLHCSFSPMKDKFEHYLQVSKTHLFIKR